MIPTTFLSTARKYLIFARSQAKLLSERDTLLELFRGHSSVLLEEGLYEASLRFLHLALSALVDDVASYYTQERPIKIDMHSEEALSRLKEAGKDYPALSGIFNLLIQPDHPFSLVWRDYLKLRQPREKTKKHEKQVILSQPSYDASVLVYYCDVFDQYLDQIYEQAQES